MILNEFTTKSGDKCRIVKNKFCGMDQLNLEVTGVRVGSPDWRRVTQVVFDSYDFAFEDKIPERLIESAIALLERVAKSRKWSR